MQSKYRIKRGHCKITHMPLTPHRVVYRIMYAFEAIAWLQIVASGGVVVLHGQQIEDTGLQVLAIIVQFEGDQVIAGGCCDVGRGRVAEGGWPS